MLKVLKGAKKDIIVSGGLTPYNINKLLAVYKPFAVDCSSGVEKKAGIKDKSKVKLLLKNVSKYEHTG